LQDAWLEQTCVDQILYLSFIGILHKKMWEENILTTLKTRWRTIRGISKLSSWTFCIKL